MSDQPIISHELIAEAAESAGHECQWQYQAHKAIGIQNQLLNPARTVLIMRCGLCGDLSEHVLSGHWSRGELKL